ncbi:pyridoxal phosphate-dependent decarboxylase family protein [Nonomuraea soli]|uniref:Glutamate/tyrosine decarboxylase-like PLP-dependent enzyme n=1 Tax=Nonomuraea soli TaxID=1032476 RepID=A0A7W0HSB5_9ACTN|nr:aminotransferase class V-fold PLP-dependent enzyme [Nonomuraea soli]MBA2893845.1 glutamate/tyrosine decarboxylase-like PLP-dependent enzyme [Nonomuraea soli]
MDEFERAARMASAYLERVPDRPVWRPVPDRTWLTEQEMPDRGRPLARLLDDIGEFVLPHPMGNGHPRFFGWVNSPPSQAGVAVAPLAAAFNPSTAGGDQAGVLLERTAVRWLAELVGFPHPPGGGLLTSGASMATIVALSAARRRALPDVRENGLYGRAPLVMYLSEEGHSCLRKAAELLGLGSANLHVVPVDAAYRMDPAALRARIERDLADGARPFLVAASAGTVNTGAVDPLAEIAAVAREHGLWFHVDGAYGALAAVTGDPVFEGMAEADSLALDPHKWLGVPVDCGCVLFRDPALVRDTFSLVPPYLRDDEGDPLGWFSEYGIEQTRPFRALRVWATIAHRGRAGVVELVRRTTGLARTLAGMVEESGDFELMAPVTTSIVAFRYTPADLPGLPAAVQRRGRAFITGTRLGGLAALRACILHPETTEADLAILLDEIRLAAKEL